MRQILKYSNHVSACVYTKFYILSLHFYEVYSTSEAKFTRKGTKYQRKSCIVLLQIETVLY